LRTNFCISKSF